MRYAAIALGAMAAFYVIGLFSMLCAVLTTFGILGVVLTRKIAQRAAQDALRARCEYEHEAWRRGDDAIAFYGQYQPQPVGRLLVWSDVLPKPRSPHAR